MTEITVSRRALGEGYSFARILNGGWQLAEGHQAAPLDIQGTLRAMARMADAGLTTFDCADIYTGVEELLGRFLASYPQRSEIQIHTKLVPDKSVLATVDRRYIEGIIDRSLLRLGVERLDLVQYHWWDPAIEGNVRTALWLRELQQAGKIRFIGATNFGMAQLREIVEAGVSLAAHQVQYSLLDQRPEEEMVDFCAAHGIQLLCYGSLAGGFLSERYLGQSEPMNAASNRSLVKYRLIIEEFGGWALFQELLAVLKEIADKHGVSLSNVAARWVLDRPQVGGAIVGARTDEHVRSNLRVFRLELDSEDRARLAAVVARGTGPRGDVFGLERQPRGRHSVIMKTDLNRLES